MTKRFMDNRAIKSGFPVERQFTSVEEIKAYLSGDRITCLMCGKDYKNLGIHSKRIHEIDADDYRFKYGIPTKYALEGSVNIEEKKKRDHSHLIAYAKAANRDAIKARMSKIISPRFCPISRQIIINNLGEELGKKDPLISLRLNDHIFSNEDFYWHLEQASMHGRYQTIEIPKDKASWSTYKKRRLHDNKLNELHKEAREKYKQTL